MLLIAPDRFSVPLYGFLQLSLRLWGVAFLLAGIAVLVAMVLQLRRPIAATAHIVASVPLLLLAYSFAVTGFWTGALNSGLLGLGIALAPLVPAPRDPTDVEGGGDLFAALAGIGAVLTSALLVLFPGDLMTPAYNLVRPYFPLYAGALLVGGVALVASQARSSLPRLVHIVGHLLTAAALFALLFTFAIPGGLWTAALYYAWFGIMLALLPLVGRRLEAIDPASLRTRLALILVAAAAFPLIVGVTLGGDAEQRSVVQAELRREQSLATLLANDVADYVTLHRAAARAIALQPGLLARTPIEQRDTLTEFGMAYPEVSFFALFDANGHPLARSDAAPLVDVAGLPIFDNARGANAPSLDLRVSRVTLRPVLAFGVPIENAERNFAGLVTVAIESNRLADFLSRVDVGPGGRAYLVDGTGRALAHPDASLVASFADLSSVPVVAAFKGSDGLDGSLGYTASGEDWLAGYAVVPVLGWGVVVEQPAGAALSSGQARRDLSFELLALFVAIAVVAGVLVARLLTAPLLALERAVERLAAGDDTAPLPGSGFSEISRLTDDFAELRDRLMTRTAERAAAQRALQQSNETLADRVGELERRDRELGLLNEVGDLLQTCHTRDDLYQVMAHGGKRLFPGDSGSICLLRESQNQVETVVDWGDDVAGERVFAPSDCWALRRGQIHRYDDSETGLLCHHLAADPHASYLCVPMLADGRGLGILHLRARRGAAGSDRALEVERKLAVAVAEHFALAVSNVKLEEKLQHQAVRDPLTGLYNRRYLEETFDREISRASRGARPIGVIMVDLDHFKQVNDTVGHAAGDELLRELGRFFLANLRDEDVACRYGGEEFTLILPDATLRDTARRAEQLSDGIKRLRVEHRGRAIGPLTVSGGVAAYPEHGVTSDALIRAADVALYRAKEAGRDRVEIADPLRTVEV